MLFLFGPTPRSKDKSYSGLAKSMVALAALFLPLTVYLAIYQVNALAKPNRHSWFENTSAQQVPMESIIALASASFEKLNRKTTNRNFIDETIKQDRTFRRLIMTVSDGRGPAKVVYSEGRGLFETWQNLITSYFNHFEASADPIWVKIDLITNIKLVAIKNGTIDTQYSPVKHGVAFDLESQLFLLPGEVVTHNIVDENKKIQLNNIKDYLAKRKSNPHAYVPFNLNQVYIFESQSWFTKENKSKDFPEQLTNSDNEIDHSQLFHALEQSFQYFSRNLEKLFSQELNSISRKKHYLAYSNLAESLFLYISMIEKAKDDLEISPIRKHIDKLLDLYEGCFFVISRSSKKDSNCAKTPLSTLARVNLALASYINHTKNRSLIPTLRRSMQLLERKVARNPNRYAASGMLNLTYRQVGIADRDKTWLSKSDRLTKLFLRNAERSDVNLLSKNTLWHLFAISSSKDTHSHPIGLTTQQMTFKQALLQASNRLVDSYQKASQSKRRAYFSKFTLAALLLEQTINFSSEVNFVFMTDLAGIIRTASQNILHFWNNEPKSLYHTDPLAFLGSFSHTSKDSKIKISEHSFAMASLLSIMQIRKAMRISGTEKIGKGF